MGEMVVTDDGCRLWTARSGTGGPLVLCHGGPGFWDTFGDLAHLLGDVATTAWPGRPCSATPGGRRSPRSPGEERELAVLRLSADFADRDRAVEHAQRLTTPFLGVNAECNRALNADRRRSVESGELLGACQDLQVPVLLVDGALDPRPRWAVDSLERALPSARRVVLDGAHLPWVEAPAAFRTAVTGFLSATWMNMPATAALRRLARVPARTARTPRRATLPRRLGAIWARPPPARPASLPTPTDLPHRDRPSPS